MKLQRLALLIAITAFLAAGCGNQQSPLGYDEASTGTVADPGADINLASSQILSAQLNVYVEFANGQPVNIHRITSDWSPSSVNWTTFDGAFDSEVEGSFSPTGRGWYSADITGLLQEWASGDSEDYGILLKQASPVPAPLVMRSMETSYAPFVEICYATFSASSCDTVFPLADLFIDQAQPGANNSGTTILLAGQLFSPGAEKQTLVRFDLLDVFSQFDVGSIGGKVWNDADQNGVYASSEQVIEQVSVNLYSCAGVPLSSTETDSTGSYRFDDLDAGDYFVEFIAPEGFEFSSANAEASDTLDSDADPASGRTECITLTAGDESLYWFAGVFEPISSDPGCTHSRNYWRRHSGFGRQADEVSGLLPIWLGDPDGKRSVLVRTKWKAFLILSNITWRSNCNGIVKLYSQLLAAKLNVGNGASDVDVKETIAQADAFLADNSWLYWRRLDRQSKKLVSNWTKQLQMYNNGNIGPGSCDRDCEIASK